MKTSFRLVSILGAIIFLGVNIFYGNANGKGKNMKEYFYVENGKMMFSREGVNSIVGKTITLKMAQNVRKMENVYLSMAVRSDWETPSEWMHPDLFTKIKETRL